MKLEIWNNRTGNSGWIKKLLWQLGAECCQFCSKIRLLITRCWSWENISAGKYHIVDLELPRISSLKWIRDLSREYDLCMCGEAQVSLLKMHFLMQQWVRTRRTRPWNVTFDLMDLDKKRVVKLGKTWDDLKKLKLYRSISCKWHGLPKRMGSIYIWKSWSKLKPSQNGNSKT